MDQFAQNRIAHLEDKVMRLEKRIDFLLKHLNLDYPDEVALKIKELISQGKKNDAVVFLHREKGLSLTEATAQVEKISKN